MSQQTKVCQKCGKHYTLDWERIGTHGTGDAKKVHEVRHTGCGGEFLSEVSRIGKAS